MHPIERLRMVARAGREAPTLLAQEAATALAAFASEPAALVTACRRLVDRQPTCGPVWWVAARVLASPDPGREARRASHELSDDPTAGALAGALPEEGEVVVLGWPEVVASGLVRRGDVRVLAIDSLDEGEGLARWLLRADGDAEAIPESGLGAAVAGCGLVVLEAAAMGHDGFVAVSGSVAAAAVARGYGIPVWVVAGEGRVLPEPLWDALVARLVRRPGPPWDRDEEIVPIEWVDAAVGPGGLGTVAEILARPTCPPAPELASGLA